MLFIRTPGLRRSALERLIARHCAQFGSVTSARLSTRDGEDVVHVTMSDAEGTGRLLLHAGDAREGDAVVIRLIQPEPLLAPELATRRSA